MVLESDASWRDLVSLHRSRHFRAGRGGHGQGKQRHGARGSEQVVAVPPGTQVEGLDGTRYDLVEPGQRAVVAAGGVGGHGNKRFATSTRQAPRFAERGLEGEAGWIELRLKLLADAGLIGQPNAGKSSLLARLTRAAPKVASYPFTTVDPVLGTLDSGDRQLVLADIPGLIEGAAGGAGLGHEFLAHVERCRILIHMVDIAGEDPAGAWRRAPSSAPATAWPLPELVVLSKRDPCRGRGGCRGRRVEARRGRRARRIQRLVGDRGRADEPGRDLRGCPRGGGALCCRHGASRPEAEHHLPAGRRPGPSSGSAMAVRDLDGTRC